MKESGTLLCVDRRPVYGCILFHSITALVFAQQLPKQEAHRPRGHVMVLQQGHRKEDQDPSVYTRTGHADTNRRV